MHLPFKYGIVSDYKPGFAKVFFEEDNLVTDWWPILMQVSLKDKESWPLNAQEHVVCLCDHRLEEGVVLGAICSDVDTPDSGAGPGLFRKIFEDGTVLQYDKSSHELKADVQGKVTINATQDVDVTTQTNLNATAIIQAKITAPIVKIDGNVTVNGVITAGGLALAAVSGVSGADGKVHGDIKITGEVAADGDVKSGVISLSEHIHGGVTTGSGVTSTPE